MPQGTTLITLDETKGFNWLHITRWFVDNQSRLNIQFADGLAPLVICGEEEVRHMLDFLSSISESIPTRTNYGDSPQANTSQDESPSFSDRFIHPT
jgi:hypothetical protein